MAADISESSGADFKGDPRNSAKLDADYPLRVLYCGGKYWKAGDEFYCVLMSCVDRFTFGPLKFFSPILPLSFGELLVDKGPWGGGTRVSQIFPTCVILYLATWPGGAYSQLANR